MRNRILDYKQVLSKLYYIEYVSKVIKNEEPIGYTTYGLPILHYTAGTGKNHIVLSASQHGCEIITTSFILELMKKVAKNDKLFNFLNKNEYTLHFLPMLNPEGYLISTSVIRKMIRKETLPEEAQTVYKEYLEEYNKDDRDCKLKLNTKTKYHQRYFGHINPYLILRSYFRDIQASLIKIYEKSDIPEGALVTWHSNGNGVDLNQNMPYNPKIQAIKEGKKLYSLLRYDNIETTKPGPIGCPMKGEEFQYEPENKALLNFLLNLKNNKEIELCAFMNYHSTGGVIYHEPCEVTKELHKEPLMNHINLESIYNKKLAEVYAKKANYRVTDTESKLNCFNDLLRLQIPGDILIELSTLPGNPLGPYIDGNYDKVIEDNMNAVAYTLQKIPEMNRIKKEFIKNKEKSFKDLPSEDMR